MNADTQVSQDGPEDGTCLNGLWHNPKGALFHRLQNLRIYEAGIQDTREPVSFAPFTGTLKPWTSFNSELSDFITSAPIVGAFERTQAKPIGMNPAEMIKLNRNHVCFENITTGSEASMKGRFDHKVLGSTVLPSLLTMLDSQTDAGEEFTVDGIRMPSSFCFGTHKKLEHLGPHHVMWSPSCMLPAGDKIKNVKLVGLYLAANNYKLSIDSNAISFKGCRAADCLGMLLEAMNIMNVKYGYLTTYMQTAFFKLEEHDEVSILHCSAIIKHSDVAKADMSTIKP